MIQQKRDYFLEQDITTELMPVSHFHFRAGYIVAGAPRHDESRITYYVWRMTYYELRITYKTEESIHERQTTARHTCMWNMQEA